MSMIYPDYSWAARMRRTVRVLEVVAIAGTIGAIAGGGSIFAFWELGGGAEPTRTATAIAATPAKPASAPALSAPAPAPAPETSPPKLAAGDPPAPPPVSVPARETPAPAPAPSVPVYDRMTPVKPQQNAHAAAKLARAKRELERKRRAFAVARSAPPPLIVPRQSSAYNEYGRGYYSRDAYGGWNGGYYEGWRNGWGD
jgi:type IV secretory pathway VirB10-like protein